MNPKIRILTIAAFLLIITITGTFFVSPYLYAPAKVVVNPYNQSLGNESYGDVVKEGPYGNTSSPIKIAVIVGVHPWEVYAHNMAIKSIKYPAKPYKYCYYIYRVNVYNGVDSDYDTGRMEGQLLAYNYVVPDIKNENYSFVIDIHSNKGAKDHYDVSWFLNVPTEDNQSTKLASEIKSSVPGLVSYDPPDATSPQYVTIPIINSGIPAVIYESYEYDPSDLEQTKMNEVLSAVDNLKLSLKYPLEKLA